jgi:peptidoglycan-associated lipoprotein
MHRRWIAVAGLTAAAACAVSGCTQTGRYVKSRWEIVRPNPVCADTRFVVYFNEGSDQLTAPARQVIAATARSYRGCDIAEVRVLGLADAVGAPEANLTLSQKRARRVAQALVEQHLPSPAFDMAAQGDQGAVRANGDDEPLRRRAEVVLTVKKH